MKTALTNLIPIAEMTPGMVATIRNSVISQLVAIAQKELNIPEEQLIVRDIESYTDLGFDYGAASGGTTNSWEHDMTLTTVGYQSVTGASTMGDQRFVAIFGVRDGRMGLGATSTASDAAGNYIPLNPVSLIKFEVGGAIKAIWDISGLMAYPFKQVGFAPGAILIPQNAAFNIYYYAKNKASVATAEDSPAYLQLLGVTVEPRGKVISP